MPSILDVEQSDSTDSEDEDPVTVTVRKRTEDNGEETDDIRNYACIE